MKKTKKVLLMGVALSLLLASNVFASDWIIDDGLWKYQLDDGSYASSGWKQIDDAWYYFNNIGYMCTGWIEDDGEHYFLDENGKWQENVTWPTFNQKEKAIWEEYIEARYIADTSTIDGDFNIALLTAILFTGDVWGSNFTNDGSRYYVPETFVKEFLRNLTGESLYTSDYYVWPWEKVNSNYIIYKGDFGSEYPFAEIRDIEEIYGGILELTGVVGDKDSLSNTITSSSQFTLRLKPSDSRIYSSYTDIMFIIY